MRAFRLLAPIALVLAGARAGRAAELLPEVSVRLRAAHYYPTEPDFHWSTWIGAGAGLLRVGPVTFYGTADVESILGDVRRPFEDNQANYHLELGLRRALGAFELGPIFHHESRHAVDRPKIQAVDWNFLGLRASGRLGGEGPRPLRLMASVARTTLVSLVGYRWEVQAGADATFAGSGPARGYAQAQGRRVTVQRSAAFPRGDFVDGRLEAGLRWTKDARALEGFLAVERRNDVLLEQPAARTRALLGFRILYNAPALFPLP